ncbi:MAG: SAM-dependent methyltransferase [Verrucomicrobiales bacterium]
MELALYHPRQGYYSNPQERPIGRRGDFFTSVAVGDTFGFLLAHALVQAWEKRFDPRRPFVVVEQGGHDGQLARDFLAGLASTGSALSKSVVYRIVEPRSAVRERLDETFRNEGFGGIETVATLEEARGEQGLFLCNELLDAFPFRRLAFEEGEWRERKVGWDEAGQAPCWVSRPLPAELTRYADELGTDFPEGYATEVCPAVATWMRDAATLFRRGLWWVIDYGYESEDYFARHRADGTLRCYRNHRATDDPFDRPGETDITAHVNFSHLAAAAAGAGLKRERFTDQHHFLVEAARPWLLAIEGEPPGESLRQRLRQFQTLTHPGLMGQQFKVAEFSRGI